MPTTTWQLPCWCLPPQKCPKQFIPKHDAVSVLPPLYHPSATDRPPVGSTFGTIAPGYPLAMQPLAIRRVQHDEYATPDSGTNRSRKLADRSDAVVLFDCRCLVEREVALCRLDGERILVVGSDPGGDTLAVGCAAVDVCLAVRGWARCCDCPVASLDQHDGKRTLFVEIALDGTSAERTLIPDLGHTDEAATSEALNFVLHGWRLARRLNCWMYAAWAWQHGWTRRLQAAVACHSAVSTQGDRCRVHALEANRLELNVVGGHTVVPRSLFESTSVCDEVLWC